VNADALKTATNSWSRSTRIWNKELGSIEAVKLADCGELHGLQSSGDISEIRIHTTHVVKNGRVFRMETRWMKSCPTQENWM